jgi:hypothetical protein
LIALNKAGWVAWKSPTAKLKLSNGRWFHSGMNGLPDISAIIPPDGRLLLVECKTENDDVRPAQDEFMELAGRNGAFCVVVKDAGQLRWIISKLRMNPELKAEDL